MNRASTFSAPYYQTAMPTRIFRVVLDYITGSDSTPNLCHGNYPVWPCHLSHRMRRVQTPGSTPLTRLAASGGVAC